MEPPTEIYSSQEMELLRNWLSGKRDFSRLLFTAFEDASGRSVSKRYKRYTWIWWRDEIIWKHWMQISSVKRGFILNGTKVKNYLCWNEPFELEVNNRITSWLPYANCYHYHNEECGTPCAVMVGEPVKGRCFNLSLLTCCKVYSFKMTENYTRDECSYRDYVGSLRGRVIHVVVIAEQFNSAVNMSLLLFVMVFIKPSKRIPGQMKCSLLD
jgi:hypothetical protein